MKTSLVFVTISDSSVSVLRVDVIFTIACRLFCVLNKQLLIFKKNREVMGFTHIGRTQNVFSE